MAEEVEKVNPDLVACDDHGKPYTVRYEAVNAMLLNEFLKEHRAVEELKTTVAKQQEAISELVAAIKELDTTNDIRGASHLVAPAQAGTKVSRGNGTRFPNYSARRAPSLRYGVAASDPPSLCYRAGKRGDARRSRRVF